jgi:hypothetical protein
MGAYLCMVPFISVQNFCMALSQFCPKLQLSADSLPCFMALLQGYLPLQYNSTLPPPVPPSFTSSLNVSDYLFPGDTSHAQANNTQGIDVRMTCTGI